MTTPVPSALAAAARRMAVPVPEWLTDQPPLKLLLEPVMLSWRGVPFCPEYTNEPLPVSAPLRVTFCTPVPPLFTILPPPEPTFRAAAIVWL